MNAPIRLCKIQDCVEPCLGRSPFCQEHHRQYCRAYYRHKRAAFQAWFSLERQRKIEGLLAASSPAERQRIQKARAEGRVLRKLAEAL